MSVSLKDYIGTDIVRGFLPSIDLLKTCPPPTPAQRGFFGAELRRLREGKRRRTKMTEEELRRRLRKK